MITRDLSRFASRPFPPCIKHSALKDEHPHLLEDVLAFPAFGKGRHGAAWDEAHAEEIAKRPELARTRWHCLSGCDCTRELDQQEYRTEAEIVSAWKAIVAKMSEV